MIANCPLTKRRGCSSGTKPGAVQTGQTAGDLHETQYSSGLPSRNGALRLRAHVPDSLTIKGALLRVEICSNCHPFFTGKQKLLDTAGRVQRFTQKEEKRT